MGLVPVPKFINEQPEWWTDMSVDQQKQYLSTYKKSKHNVVPDNPSGKEERDDIVKSHNVKPWTEDNYTAESEELTDTSQIAIFDEMGGEEAAQYIKDNETSRELKPDEIDGMLNSGAGQAQKIMNDDSGAPDDYGDTDKEEKVKNIINYENFESGTDRWEYTQEAIDEFGEENLPQFDKNLNGDDPWAAEENVEGYKKFKKMMRDPKYVTKKEGGAAGKWRDVDGLVDAFKGGATIPSNLVAKDKEGGTQLIGGNTRFVAAIAAGVNPITKVIPVPKVGDV